MAPSLGRQDRRIVCKIAACSPPFESWAEALITQRECLMRWF